MAAYPTRPPRMDRMAEEGLLVSHCISQPLCTPSRVKLMTGLSNARNYTRFGRLDTAWLNMGTLMKEAGYHTCIAGKWQLNGLAYKEEFPDWNDPTRPNQMGFDEYCLWQLTRARSEGERYSDPLIEQNGKVLETGPDDYGPDIFCDFIIDFIHRKSRDPFFVYYPMVLVHEPFVPTPVSGEWEDPAMRYRNDTAFFGDMMAYTDRIVGRILDALEEEGIAEETLVIFTADNGTHPRVYTRTGERLVRGGKGNTINDGVHVPLLVSWPGKIISHRVYNGLIEFSDFFATLADLVDREVVCDGHSFLPLLEGRPYRERETVRVHYDPRWGQRVNRYRDYFAQTMDHKLYQDGSFFDLGNDIMEENPLDRDQLNSWEAAAYQKLETALFPVPESPPNLLLIITDDQGYGDLSLHGNTLLETPHLDAIGLGGVRLDNFHVSPVCAPTRAALLTGRRPMSTGAYWVTRGGGVMDDGEYTIAEVLGDNGYATGCFGKWHNGAHYPYHPLSQGFDEFYGFTAGHINRYFNPELEHNGRLVHEEGYIADLFTDHAISYIREHGEGPFFCYLAYNTPHTPFQVPDEYFDMYKDKAEGADSAERIANASVYGMVKNIDDNVGRILETLRDLELEEETVVVFMTDNGPNTWRYNQGMKGRKAWVNDGGVRVPCFIRWKGHLPENKVVNSMTAHIDLLPTLTDLMGVRFEPRRPIHGISLVPRIRGVDREEERFLFTHVNHGQQVKPLPGAVRTNDWRLTFTDPARPELTRRSDRGELHNLADSLPGLADSLMDLYHAWFEPFESHVIPPIPVGVIDSVILPAHEGFLSGNASYFRSPDGWSHDWATSLDMEGSTITWKIDTREAGNYHCQVRYTSPAGDALIRMETGEQLVERVLPRFIPVKEKNYNRIDRPAEAVGQSWGRLDLGTVQLTGGTGEVVIKASDPGVEILQLVLLKQ